MINEDKFSVIKPYSDNSLTIYLIPFLRSHSKLESLLKFIGFNNDLIEFHQ